jgi:lambda family phage portal protein
MKVLGLEISRAKAEPEVVEETPVRKAKPKRGYAAAASKARYGDFVTSGGSADHELRQGLRIVRNKSRYLARNSSSMKRFLDLLTLNVVGSTGMVFDSRVRKQDGALDKGLNDRVKDEFLKWWSRPTTCQTLTDKQLMKQGLRSLARDGELFWEVVFNSKYPDGIGIRPFEADLVDETLNTPAQTTGNQIRMGVEVDDDNRPIAYHVLTQHPGDTTWYSRRAKRRYRRVPADRIIHLFDSERPGQTRGAPWSSTIINSIKMLDGYREAEVMNRRVKAATMGFFTSDEPTQQGIDELADVEDESEDVLEMQMEPGILKQLPPGLSFESFDPGGSQTDYKAFEGQVKKDVSMGAGISAMSHGMETEGVSYSAGRTISLEDREFYKDCQTLLIDNALNIIFDMWLSRRILQVESQIPPTRLDAIRENFKFRPRGWDWVDPAKDVAANAQALQTKQTSLRRVAAQRGISLEDLLDEIEEDERAAKERGLTLTYDKTNTSANDSNGEPNDNSDASNSQSGN